MSVELPTARKNKVKFLVKCVEIYLGELRKNSKWVLGGVSGLSSVEF